MLRADNAPVVAALLSKHLGGEKRRLPDAEVYELIDHDLDLLRAHGFDLPQRAQSYCADGGRPGSSPVEPSARHEAKHSN